MLRFDMVRIGSWLVLGALTWLVACGSTSSDPGATGGNAGSAASDSGGTGAASDGGGGSAASSGSSGAGGALASGGTGGVVPGCPADVPPTPGSECIPGAAICQYSCESCKCATGTWECEAHECKTLCSHPGAWCSTSSNDCLCWGGSWACAKGDAGAEPSTLPNIVAEGEACSDAQMVCRARGSNGAACKCESGKWTCAPEALPNEGCPTTFENGTSCASPGQFCQQSGFCQPVCVCQLSGTWACSLFTPC